MSNATVTVRSSSGAVASDAFAGQYATPINSAPAKAQFAADRYKNWPGM